MFKRIKTRSDMFRYIVPRQLQPIATLLKSARERKGLSQRALGKRVGLPQSHISKIENAAVDLQTTNLMQIARALDLELTLVPRATLPAVQSLQETLNTSGHSTTGAPAKRLPAYRLTDDEEEDNA